MGIQGQRLAIPKQLETPSALALIFEVSRLQVAELRVPFRGFLIRLWLGRVERRVGGLRGVHQAAAAKPVTASGPCAFANGLAIPTTAPCPRALQCDRGLRKPAAGRHG